MGNLTYKLKEDFFFFIKGWRKGLTYKAKKTMYNKAVKKQGRL